MKDETKFKDVKDFDGKHYGTEEENEKFEKELVEFKKD